MTRLEQANVARYALLKFTEHLTLPALAEACQVVLGHPKFVISFGGTTHHAYEGGLAIHTMEVTQYAMMMAGMFPGKAKLDVVITAGIFHDFMKIKDYVGMAKAIDGKKIPEDIVMGIEHAILAHHGKYEFGSPVQPQLLEAYILHYADNFSKHFGEGRK